MTSKLTAADDRQTKREENAYYVLGGSDLGSAVARRLGADGHDVRVVDDGYDQSDISGLRGSPTDVRTLEAAGVETASTVVVATNSDRQNLLIAQLVSARFGVGNVVVLTNAPDRLAVFAEAGHDPVCATSVLSEALVDAV